MSKVSFLYSQYLQNMMQLIVTRKKFNSKMQAKSKSFLSLNTKFTKPSDIISFGNQSIRFLISIYIFPNSKFNIINSTVYMIQKL